MRSLSILFVLSLISLVAGCGESKPMDMESKVALDKIEAEAAADQAAPANTAVLYVHGMGCPQCANNVDVQLLKLKGVEGVKIDLGTGKVLAQLSPATPPTKDQLVNAIKRTGFTLVKINMPNS